MSRSWARVAAAVPSFAMPTWLPLGSRAAVRAASAPRWPRRAATRRSRWAAAAGLAYTPCCGGCSLSRFFAKLAKACPGPLPCPGIRCSPQGSGINVGLLYLGMVIKELAEAGSTLGYRNSLLTEILKPGTWGGVGGQALGWADGGCVRCSQRRRPHAHPWLRPACVSVAHATPPPDPCSAGGRRQRGDGRLQHAHDWLHQPAGPPPGQHPQHAGVSGSCSCMGKQGKLWCTQFATPEGCAW